MKLICDICGKIEEQKFGIKIAGQKICVRCLAGYMVDRMPMPKESARETRIENRIKKIEKKLDRMTT